MATVITGTNYHAIAVFYGDIVTQLAGTSGYLYDAVYQIILMSDYYPTLDLLDTFNAVYTVNANAYSSLAPFTPAVKQINTHILSRGAGIYTSVGGPESTSYLKATGTTVPNAWAELCLAAGTLIDPSNIVG